MLLWKENETAARILLLLRALYDVRLRSITTTEIEVEAEIDSNLQEVDTTVTLEDDLQPEITFGRTIFHADHRTITVVITIHAESRRLCDVLLIPLLPLRTISEDAGAMIDVLAVRPIPSTVAVAAEAKVEDTRGVAVAVVVVVAVTRFLPPRPTIHDPVTNHHPHNPVAAAHRITVTPLPAATAVLPRNKRRNRNCKTRHPKTNAPSLSTSSSCAPRNEMFPSTFAANTKYPSMRLFCCATDDRSDTRGVPMWN